MGLSTLGFDPTRFQAEPPACYRASWQLLGRDSHPLATTSLCWNHLINKPLQLWAHCWNLGKTGRPFGRPATAAASASACSGISERRSLDPPDPGSGGSLRGHLLANGVAVDGIRRQPRTGARDVASPTRTAGA